MKKEKQRKEYDATVIIVIALVFVIILAAFILLLHFPTTVRAFNKKKIAQLEKRYQRLQNLLNKRVKLKNRLGRVTSYVLKSLRCLIVVIIFTIYLICYFRFHVKTLELIEYTSGIIFLLAILGFAFVGNIKNFLDIWKFIEIKVKLFIFRKYPNIEQQILENDKELKEIAIEKGALQAELDSIQKDEDELLNILKGINDNL